MKVMDTVKMPQGKYKLKFTTHLYRDGLLNHRPCTLECALHIIHIRYTPFI